MPIWIACLVLFVYASAARAAAASGTLLGVSALFVVVLVQGLRACASFNARPGGGCQADATAELAITAVVFAAALLNTAFAVRRATSSR